MATIPDDEGIAIEAQGCSPTLALLVGLEAMRREAKPIRDPREEAGGKWLDPRRTELMDEALWDNLERLKKQRKWKERGVAEREAKRQRRDEEGRGGGHEALLAGRTIPLSQYHQLHLSLPHWDLDP